MASANTIVISPDLHGNFHLGSGAEAAKRTSELLQHNLDNFHMIFMERRHNHEVHHLLTIYALGASADEIQKAFDINASYQLPKPRIDENVVQALYDKNRFKDFLDKPDHYSSYLAFFQREIETKGVEAVLVEHVFANDEHANTMLVRVFASIMHPVLHLGFAFEFNQPAIVAEALAQAAIHAEDVNSLGEYFLSAEKAAGGGGGGGGGGVGKPGKDNLRQLMDEVEKFKTALSNAFDEIVSCASRYKISVEQINERILEMTDALSATLTVIPGPVESYKVDFFLLHLVNTLVLLPSLMKHAWLSTHNKLRLLEWIGRYDLLLYIAQSSPKLTTEDLATCKQRQGTWEEVIRYSIRHPTDDGHLAKMVRALAFGQQLTKPLQSFGNPSNLLMEDHMWLKLAILGCDSVPESCVNSEDRWRYF
ncbi:putative HypA-like protein [Cadophora sp. MPI-SDFR-AT-0126]|nr:putative HypA-like protein [Leotiomycetes sp. MPI-SDFR-AT-0126]